MSTPVPPEKLSRRQQLVQTYKMARKSDTRIGLWMLGAFLLGFAVGFGIFWILPGSGVLGLVLSLVGGLLIGFRAVRSDELGVGKEWFGTVECGWGAFH